MKNITYAIDKDTGQVYSRFGNNIAIPILDYEGMTPQNNFKTNYFLESHSVLYGRYMDCSNMDKENTCQYQKHSPNILGNETTEGGRAMTFFKWLIIYICIIGMMILLSLTCK